VRIKKADHGCSQNDVCVAGIVPPAANLETADSQIVVDPTAGQGEGVTMYLEFVDARAGRSPSTRDQVPGSSAH
jgi:hypothetical protein